MADDMFNDLTSGQKGVIAFRGGLAVLTVSSTVIGGLILGYVREARVQLTDQSKDIAQIKFEIPEIKQGRKDDKALLMGQISDARDDIKTTRESIDGIRREVSDIQVKQAVLEQKSNP